MLASAMCGVPPAHRRSDSSLSGTMPTLNIAFRFPLRPWRVETLDDRSGSGTGRVRTECLVFARRAIAIC